MHDLLCTLLFCALLFKTISGVKRTTNGVAVITTNVVDMTTEITILGSKGPRMELLL